VPSVAQLQATLSEQVEFELAHRSLQAAKKAVIDQLRIVNSVWIDNQSTYQAT